MNKYILFIDLTDGTVNKQEKQIDMQSRESDRDVGTLEILFFVEKYKKQKQIYCINYFVSF